MVTFGDVDTDPVSDHLEGIHQQVEQPCEGKLQVGSLVETSGRKQQTKHRRTYNKDD